MRSHVARGLGTALLATAVSGCSVLTTSPLPTPVRSEAEPAPTVVVTVTTTATPTPSPSLTWKQALGVAAPATVRIAVQGCDGKTGTGPYFVQAIGKHVWDLAPGPGVHLSDVKAGSLPARNEIDSGLYRSRWERATAAQRQLLAGMAELDADNRPIEISDLAAHLGHKRSSNLSVARQELIKKGLIYAPERGRLAFTVPGMADFILSQHA